MEKKNTLTWNKVLTAVLAMPGVRVERTAFLRHELKPYYSDSKLDLLPSVRPYTIATDEVIDRVANRVIKHHTTLATAASTIAGLPGGLAMAATIPGDILQYYYHVVVLSQKLAYIYGFPDFCEEQKEEDGTAAAAPQNAAADAPQNAAAVSQDAAAAPQNAAAAAAQDAAATDGAAPAKTPQLSPMAADLLTIFIGSMMGVKAADQGISQIAEGVARSAVGRLPRVALTKAAIYPIASKIAQMIGLKFTREGFARGLGKLIPLAGGLFSGGLTLYSFPIGARRLQQRLKAQKGHFAKGDIDALDYENIKSSFAKAERNQNRKEEKQKAVIEAMINMANIDGRTSKHAYQLVEEKVAQGDMDNDEKLELLGTLNTEAADERPANYDVDYDLLACYPDFAHDAIVSMIAVARADGQPLSAAQQMYLTMTAKAVGISKQQLDDMLNASAAEQ